MSFTASESVQERKAQVEEGRRLAGQTLTVRPDASPRPDTRSAAERHAIVHLPFVSTPFVVPSFGRKTPSNRVVIKTPTGHEAFLKALETSGAQIEVEKMSGEKLIGKVKHSDKFTISMRVESDGVTRDRVLFKHDISEFSALSPRPAPASNNDEEGRAQ